MSQDTSERQLDGHQQLRQTDASVSEEYDTVESTENISIKQVCPLHGNSMFLCIYAFKNQYKYIYNLIQNMTGLHIYD